MPRIVDLVRRLRPAPFKSAVAYLFGLHKRRLLQTKHGAFLIKPISNWNDQLVAGEYEPTLVEVLHQHLRPGALFIDLGANEGYFSVIASRLVGPRGTVVAVEPQSRLQGVLQANFSLNHCYNIRLVKAVVSSKTEKVQLNLTPGTNAGGSSLFHTARYPLRTEQVQSFTLAEFLEKIGADRCDLMKVDIEGAEYDVFMGATEILRAGIIRNIALEIHNTILESRGLSGDQLHQSILTCGYELNDKLGPWVYTFVGNSPSGSGAR